MIVQLRLTRIDSKWRTNRHVLAEYFDFKVDDINGLMGVSGTFDLGKPALAHPRLSTLLSAPLLPRR